MGCGGSKASATAVAKPDEQQGASKTLLQEPAASDKVMKSEDSTAPAATQPSAQSPSAEDGKEAMETKPVWKHIDTENLANESSAQSSEAIRDSAQTGEPVVSAEVKAEDDVAQVEPAADEHKSPADRAEATPTEKEASQVEPTADEPQLSADDEELSPRKRRAAGESTADEPQLSADHEELSPRKKRAAGESTADEPQLSADDAELSPRKKRAAPDATEDTTPADDLGKAAASVAVVVDDAEAKVDSAVAGETGSSFSCFQYCRAAESQTEILVQKE